MLFRSSCNKTAPAAPKNVSVSGLTVTWDAVADATSYEVKIGAQIFNVTDASFDLSNENLSLTKNQNYTVQVKAIAGNESSAYSAAVSFGYYTMGNTLVYKNGTVYWTAVAGLSNFEVRVNGGAAVAVSNVSSYKVALTKAGVNTVEVRCADLDGSEWLSVEVYAYSVTYVSRTYGGDVVEYVAVGDTLALPATFEKVGYTLTGWYNTPGAANGNGKPYASTVFTGNGDVVLYAN